MPSVLPRYLSGETVMAESKLNLRDQFAMAALIGMLASAPMCDRSSVNKLRWAEAAYDWATAMQVMRKGKARAKR